MSDINYELLEWCRKNGVQRIADNGTECIFFPQLDEAGTIDLQTALAERDLFTEQQSEDVLFHSAGS